MDRHATLAMTRPGGHAELVVVTGNPVGVGQSICLFSGYFILMTMMDINPLDARDDVPSLGALLQ